MIEATWDGAEPLDLGGSARRFLEDGDEVVLSGCATREGRQIVALGEVRGTIAAGLDGQGSERRDWRA